MDLIRINHYFIVNSIECFYNKCPGQQPLNFFAQGIMIADCQSRRHAAGKIQRVSYINQYLIF